MKKILALAVAIALVFAFAACKKKEEQPITQGGGQELPAGHPSTTGGPMGESQFVTQVSKVEVPSIVKGKWSAVVITIEDKKGNKFEDATIKLGTEYKIAGSNVKIKVGDFLPDFKMGEALITSVSNDPNNPAVNVTITEGNNEIFKGWLYAKFPAIHPFQHEKYGLVLKEGIPVK